MLMTYLYSPNYLLLSHKALHGHSSVHTYIPTMMVKDSALISRSEQFWEDSICYHGDASVNAAVVLELQV